METTITRDYLFEKFEKYGGETHFLESNDPNVPDVLAYRLHLFAVLDKRNKMSLRILKVSKLLYYANQLPEDKVTPELKESIKEGKEFLRKELGL